MQSNQTNLLDKLKQDFKVFLTLIWKHLNLPKPTLMQYYIADYLQDPQHKRKIIQAFRGIGKSYITGAYVTWRLFKDPEEKILVVSASKQRADDFSIFVQRLIQEVPFLQYLYPTPDQRQSRVAFDVSPAKNSQSPSVKSVGITGQLTGSRASLIIADDVEVRNNSMTEDMREKLLKAVGEFEAILMPIPTAQIIFLGTPQTYESIYNKLRHTRNYNRCIIPARYPEVSSIYDVYTGDLHPAITRQLEIKPDIVGKPTDPERFSEFELKERELSYGRTDFNLQFMLDTTLSDLEKYPLKLYDLIVYEAPIDKAPVNITWTRDSKYIVENIANVGFSGDRLHRPLFVDSKFSEYEGKVMAIDIAGRGKDKTAYAIVNYLHGLLYVLDAGTLEGGYEKDTLIALSNIANKYKVNLILIEENFSDGMFTELFKPILAKYYPCTVEAVKHFTQKELRIIDSLEPVMNQHRLILSESLIRKDLKNLETDNIQHSLLYQLTHITRDKGSLRHDDILDALAIGVKYWTDKMNRDIDNSIREYNERTLLNELDKFLNSKIVIGNKYRQRNPYNVLGFK